MTIKRNKSEHDGLYYCVDPKRTRKGLDLHTLVGMTEQLDYFDKYAKLYSIKLEHVKLFNRDLIAPHKSRLSERIKSIKRKKDKT